MIHDILYFLGCTLVVLPSVVLMGVAVYTHPIEFALVGAGLGIMSVGLYLVNKHR